MLFLHIQIFIYTKFENIYRKHFNQIKNKIAEFQIYQIVCLKVFKQQFKEWNESIENLIRNIWIFSTSQSHRPLNEWQPPAFVVLLAFIKKFINKFRTWIFTHTRTHKWNIYQLMGWTAIPNNLKFNVLVAFSSFHFQVKWILST